MTRGDVYFIKNPKLDNGCAQRPDRHAVIVSNDMLNALNSFVNVCYMTVKPVSDMPTHAITRCTGCASTIMCETLNQVHISAIGTKAGELTESEMQAMNAALAITLGIDFSSTESKVVEKPVEKIVMREPTNEELEAKAREIMAMERENAPVEPDPDFAELSKKRAGIVFSDTEDMVKRIEVETMYNIVREDNIRLEVERDVYRDMYHNLVNKLMGDGE